MEVWRDELYHALRIGSFNLPKIGIKSIGGKTNGNGEWKQHKYIRKEGNKYIYPEDLKNKSKTPSRASLLKPNKDDDPVTAAYKKAVRKRNTTFGRLGNFNVDYNREGNLHSSTSGVKGNILANKLNRELKRQQKKNVITPKNTIKGSINVDRDVYTLQATVQYKNGSKFFDTVSANNYYDYQDVGGQGGINNAYTQRTEYTVEYGTLHQQVNKGRDFVNKYLGKKKG